MNNVAFLEFEQQKIVDSYRGWRLRTPAPWPVLTWCAVIAPCRCRSTWPHLPLTAVAPATSTDQAAAAAEAA